MGYSQRRRPEVIVAHQFVLAVGLLLVALLQTALPPRSGLLVPNILLLLIIFKALLAGPGAAAPWAFYGGLALDIAAGSVLGTHALAFLAAVMLVSFLLVRLSHSNWLLPLLGALFGIFMYHAVLAALISLTVKAVHIMSYTLVSLLPDLLVTLIPALPIFLVMRWWHEQHPDRITMEF